MIKIRSQFDDWDFLIKVKFELITFQWYQVYITLR